MKGRREGGREVGGRKNKREEGGKEGGRLSVQLGLGGNHGFGGSPKAGRLHSSLGLGTVCVLEDTPGRHQSHRSDIPRDIGRLALVTLCVSYWPTFSPLLL